MRAGETTLSPATTTSATLRAASTRSAGAASQVTTNRRLRGLREVLRLEVELQTLRHDNHSGRWWLTGCRAKVLILRACAGRTVALGGHRAGARDDDIGQRAQQPEHLLVGRVAEAAGPPVDRRRAVGARDHVDAQPRRVRRIAGTPERGRRRRPGRESSRRRGTAHSQSAGEDRDRLGRQRHSARAQLDGG